MTNVVVAAFTTAQARLKLFKHRHTLEPRALYYESRFFMSQDPAIPNYHCVPPRDRSLMSSQILVQEHTSPYLHQEVHSFTHTNSEGQTEL